MEGLGIRSLLPPLRRSFLLVEDVMKKAACDISSKGKKKFMRSDRPRNGFFLLYPSHSLYLLTTTNSTGYWLAGDQTRGSHRARFGTYRNKGIFFNNSTMDFSLKKKGSSLVDDRLISCEINSCNAVVDRFASLQRKLCKKNLLFSRFSCEDKIKASRNNIRNGKH